MSTLVPAGTPITIVRISEHDEETNLLNLLQLPVDSLNYARVPKKIFVTTLINYIINTFLSDHIRSESAIRLSADTAAPMTFKVEGVNTPFPIADAYFLAINVYDDTNGQVGYELATRTASGFTITPIGDCYIDYFAIQIPLAP